MDALPEITVQKIIAGKQKDIETERAEIILGINGVEDVVSRVWGYYYFENMGVNFTVIGVDVFENQYKDSLQNIVDNFDENITFI